MDPFFQDFLRRVLAVVVFAIGLFYLVLWAMPYAHVPAQIAYWLSAGDPLIGILLGLAGLVGVLWVAANPKIWIDGGFGITYRAIKLVF